VAIAATTMRKLMAFAQNARARPPKAIAAPASDGPMIRDRLNWAEFRAIALPRARPCTSDDRIAW
jgi:hypothetical protein